MPQIEPAVGSSVIARPLRLGFSRDGDERLSIEIVGELDLADADHLYALLVAAEEGATDVVVDLSACDFLDLSALALLLAARRDLAARGRRLELREPRAQARKLFALVGVTLP